MFELQKSVELIEGKLAEAWEHNESGQQYQYIEGLEAALNILRNELHAVTIVIDQFEMEAN